MDDNSVYRATANEMLTDLLMNNKARASAVVSDKQGIAGSSSTLRHGLRSLFSKFENDILQQSESTRIKQNQQAFLAHLKNELDAIVRNFN